MTNYQKGVRKEYALMKHLRKTEFGLVLRSAGSHSEVDVIGIDEKTRKVMLYQCKPNNMSEKEKEKIRKRNEWLKGSFEVNFEVI